MLCLKQIGTEPYFNVATEEYLLRSFSEDICMLWRNDPSIVVGKHQNTFAEINHRFVRSRGIKVVRRLSGGGTVYHDRGNLNFTFISNGTAGSLVDFKKHTLPIIDFLATLGVEARLGGKNDLRVAGKKISGNAGHLYKNRVLHHGTLLFSTNLADLEEAIIPLHAEYSDKAVKSISSEVTNIVDHLPKHITFETFADRAMEFILRYFQSSASYTLANADIAAIERLVDTKYSKWEWNYGYSPSYTLQREIEIENSAMVIALKVENGYLSSIDCSGPSPESMLMAELFLDLVGCSLNYESVQEWLAEKNHALSRLGLNPDRLLEGLF